MAAQMALLELEGGPANVKNADLNRMYKDHREFNVGGPKVAKIRRTLGYLKELFPQKTPELERYSVVSLYLLVSHLLERYVINGRQPTTCNVVHHFRTAPARSAATTNRRV